VIHERSQRPTHNGQSRPAAASLVKQNFRLSGGFVNLDLILERRYAVLAGQSLSNKTQQN
jgi:hypothetical protein